MSDYRGILGIVVLLGLAAAFSKDRRRIPLRLVLIGMVLLFVIGLLPTSAVMGFLASAVTQLLSFSERGISLVWGELANPGASWGFVFAIKVLPVIIYFSSFMAILYHLGVMQRVIGFVSGCIKFLFGSSLTGTEALAAGANIFIGHTEAPLLVKPYIRTMTQSQLMTLMTCGFSTISCTVLGVYASFLAGNDIVAQEEFTKHLLTASLMSAIAALVIAKMLVPETETINEKELSVEIEEAETGNLIDAAAMGASKGVRLAVNIGAMLVAFGALIAMVNWALLEVSSLVGVPVTLESMIGTVLGPFVWLMGLDPEFGSFLGKELVVTEFLAFQDLGETRALDPNYLSQRSYIIGAYALCSFANIPSIAIQIGGLTAIAPERRSDFARLGAKAMIAGLMASCLTACIAGLLL